MSTFNPPDRAVVTARCVGPYKPLHMPISNILVKLTRQLTPTGRLVRESRRRAGWTQAELARRVGASVAWVQRLERDASTVSLHLVARACMELRLFRNARRLIDLARRIPGPPIPSTRHDSSWLDHSCWAYPSSDYAREACGEALSRPPVRDDLLGDWEIHLGDDHAFLGRLHVRSQGRETWAEVVTLGPAGNPMISLPLAMRPELGEVDQYVGASEHVRLDALDAPAESAVPRLLWSTAASSFGARLLASGLAQLSAVGQLQTPRGKPISRHWSLTRLMAVPDRLRQGSIRLRRSVSIPQPPTQPSTTQDRPLPREDRLLHMHDAVRAVHMGEADVDQVLECLNAATSLGGDRPKCTFIDASGALAVAKFPAVDDAIDLNGVEALTVRVATRCGLLPQPVRLVLRRGPDHPLILVAKRMDRDVEGRSLGYMPARVLVHECLASDADTSFLLEVTQLLRWMRLACRDSATATRLLYQRLLFSALIAQPGDPLRKVAFLHCGGHYWNLAPAVGWRIGDVAGPSTATHTHSTVQRSGPELASMVQLAPLFGSSVVQAVALLRLQAMNWIAWRSEAAAIGWVPKPNESDAIHEAVQRMQARAGRAAMRRYDQRLDLLESLIVS